MDHPEIAFYNEQTRSIRESLIPCSEFCAQVKRFEENPQYGLLVSSPSDDKVKGLYCVPYPFKRTTLTMILEARSGTGGPLSDAEKSTWQSVVETRMGRILHHRITEDDINMLDNNGDVGVILNRLDGSFVPFLYSKLSGIEVVGIGVREQYFLLQSRKHSFHGTVDEYNRLTEYFFRHLRDYTTYLNLRYDDPNGDYWHMDNDAVYITPDAPFTRDYFKNIAEYIQLSLIAHKKVIDFI